MAVFQYNNLVLPYQVAFAPFPHDLLLLQDSRFTPDFWKPVLEDLSGEPAAGGRIVTCEAPWPEPEFFDRFISTLGLHNVYTASIGDGTDLVKKLERAEPGRFVKTLFLNQNIKSGDLAREVRGLCGL
jgi:hypothetical protein